MKNITQLRNKMTLKTKFLISICTIVLVSYGVTFYRTSLFQDKLVRASALRQARMLSKHIILTRKWVADHNGLFLVKGEDAQPNPFLDDPEISDRNGTYYVKRNPAMVTRELSEYADSSDFGKFKVTSLMPVNILNAPDEFEKKSLKLFEKGHTEISHIEKTKKGRSLRYITPLMVETSCLQCHAKHGYEIGDIRGGLSLTIPIDWADKAISINNKMLFLLALATIVLVSLTILLLIHFIVVRKLTRLSTAMDSYPDKEPDISNLPNESDEIGVLSEKFIDLGERLVLSNKQLDHAREHMYQAEKMAALGRLSAGIAHEVNNPLGGMRNCVKSMKNNPSDAALHERYLDLLDKGLRRVESTMRQLLNFGRKEPLRMREADIDAVIKECFALMEYRLVNIELIWELNLQKSLYIDVEAIKQVVVNLGLNAIHSMPDGGKLTVGTSENKTSLFVKITDTGCGIDPENIREIFDPFFTTKDIGEGTGLGLTVSFNLVYGMGGNIIVESQKGQGSSFIIELPKNSNC